MSSTVGPGFRACGFYGDRRVAERVEIAFDAAWAVGYPHGKRIHGLVVACPLGEDGHRGPPNPEWRELLAVKERAAAPGADRRAVWLELERASWVAPVTSR